MIKMICVDFTKETLVVKVVVVVVVVKVVVVVVVAKRLTKMQTEKVVGAPAD